MRFLPRISVLALLLLGACSDQLVPRPRTNDEARLFGAVSMKLDTFSKVKDWTGNGVPDGIEALVEFDDRFGDRTKAAGTILFELYDFRPQFPDPRGERLANPWTASLVSFDEQKAHWETASGAYMFRLGLASLAWSKHYVLMATFESSSGERFFSHIILQARKTEKPGEPTTNPSGQASAR